MTMNDEQARRMIVQAAAYLSWKYCDQPCLEARNMDFAISQLMEAIDAYFTRPAASGQV